MHFPAAVRARRQYTESYIIRSIYKTDIKSGLHIICLHLLGPGHSLAGPWCFICRTAPQTTFPRASCRHMLQKTSVKDIFHNAGRLSQSGQKACIIYYITNNCLSRQLSHRPHGYKDSQTGHRELYINSAVLNGLYPQSRYWNLPSGPVPGQPGPESERRRGKRTPR